MNRTKDRIQNLILFMTDLACLFAAYVLSGYLWLVVHKGFSVDNTFRQLHVNVVTLLIAYLIMSLVYMGNNMFTARGYIDELKVVFTKAVLLAGLVGVVNLLFKRKTAFPRGVYILSITIGMIFMWAVRIIVKKLLVINGQKRNSLCMIAIANEEKARAIADRNKKSDDWMRHLASFIIIDKDMVGQNIEDIPVVASHETMMEYIQKEIADEVYIDVDYESINQIKPMVMELEDMGVTVHLRLDILDAFKGFDVSLGNVNGRQVATFAHRIYAYKKLALKRFVDIIGGLVGLIIMLIALIFIGPAIKINSKGPIFFKQKRVGKGGRYFYIYKFRSMYIDAEERKKELLDKNEMDGLMFKMDNDPRITPVGRFIRKTSIDELPQFINVLKGDMSLVGTRPPTIDEFKQYEGHHRRRLTMKPGITGMWQAYGRDSVSNFEDIVQMDLEYIDNWSPTLDVKILCKTVVTVLGGSGR